MNITDLPTELLLQIINLLSNEDLYSLATLSRQLQNLTLPIYLRIHNLPHPETKTAIHLGLVNRFDGLSGLAIMTNLTSIDHLWCNIYPFHGAQQKFQTVADKLYQLSRVIHRLDSVSNVEIAFNGVCSADDRTRMIPDTTLQAWVDCTAALLNAVVEKGCTTLIVRYGYWAQDAYLLELRPSMFARLRRKFGAIKSSSLQSSSWRFHRPPLAGYSNPILMQPSENLFTTCKLCSLSISSCIFLVHPYLNWIVSVLRLGTSITSLSFGSSGRQGGVWKAALFLMAEALSGRLTELSFGRNCSGLHFVDILEFLTHSPRLTHLRVHHEHYLTIPATCKEPSGIAHLCSLPRPHLPALQTLIAPLTFMLHLSRSSHFKISPCLPKLQNWVASVDGTRFFRDYHYMKNFALHSSVRKYLPRNLIFIVQVVGTPQGILSTSPDHDKIIKAMENGHLPSVQQATHLQLEVRLNLEIDDLRILVCLFPDLRELNLRQSLLDVDPYLEVSPENSTPQPNEECKEFLLSLKRACVKLERVISERYIFELPDDGSIHVGPLE